MARVLGKSWLTLKSLYRKVRYRYWSYRAKNKGSLPEKGKINSPAVLFLLPESGIKLFMQTLIVIASQLKLQGYQLYFARCFNLFERCNFMDSESLPINATSAEKKLLCSYCFRSFEKNVVKNNFDFVDMRHFITENDQDEIKAVIAKHPKKTFDFSVDDINISGILEYSLFSYLKKSDISTLSDEEINQWQQRLSSLYVGYKGTQRIIDKLSISHIVMCEEYSFNALIKELAKKRAISLVNISRPYHKDIDLDHIRIFRKEGLVESCEALGRWGEFSKLSLSAHQIKDIVDDLIVRMTKRGIYSYSPSKNGQDDLFALLGLDKHKNTIVAYPSSPDEIGNVLNSYRKRELTLKNTRDAFCDQFEWLDELILFAENSNNFQLIIRLHPRMQPNHRERWGCPEYSVFVEKYSRAFKNVKVIWPADQISSFDLAELADVVTVSWSSMGLFMARLGLPVVSGLKYSLPLPNDDFHLFSPTKEDYFSNLQSLCDAPSDPQRLKNAYRWYNMVTLGHCINLADVMQHSGPGDTQSKNALMLQKAIIENQDVLDINFKSLQAIQSVQNDNLENQALRKQLFRLIHFFMTDKDEDDAAQFPIYINRLSNCEPHYLILRRKDIEYYYQGRVYQKCSPMIARMVLLTQQFAQQHSKEIGVTELACLTE